MNAEVRAGFSSILIYIPPFQVIRLPPALEIAKNIPPPSLNVSEWLIKIKSWNASRICVSSLRRGHANLLCIVPILIYVPPKLSTNQS